MLQKCFNRQTFDNILIICGSIKLEYSILHNDKKLSPPIAGLLHFLNSILSFVLSDNMILVTFSHFHIPEQGQIHSFQCYNLRCFGENDDLGYLGGLLALLTCSLEFDL